MTDLNPAPVASESVWPAPAGTPAYQQQLQRALTMNENILITLSAVTPASSVFIIVPTVLLGVGGASVLIVAMGTIVVGVVYYYGFIHPRRDERWLLADPINEELD